MVAPFKELSRLEFYVYGAVLGISLFALYHFMSDNRGTRQRRRRRNRNTARLRLVDKERGCDSSTSAHHRDQQFRNPYIASTPPSTLSATLLPQRAEDDVESKVYPHPTNGIMGQRQTKRQMSGTLRRRRRHETDGVDAIQEGVEDGSVGSPAGLALLDSSEDDTVGDTVPSFGVTSSSGCDEGGPLRLEEVKEDHIEARESPRKSDGSPPRACVISPSPPRSPEAQVPETKSCVTVLISKGVCDYRQKANQNTTIDTLNDFAIPHTLVDGMDQTQTAAREKLFEISGIRGNYPQIFLTSSASGDSAYLGGYEWLTSEANLQDLKRRCCAGGKNEEGIELCCSSSATPGSSPAQPMPRFTVLVSNGVFDPKQRANQEAALRLLRGVDIDYEIVDGMDPAQKGRRDAFFAISGLRGYYPQVFFDRTHYLGGYDYLRGLQKELAQQQGE